MTPPPTRPSGPTETDSQGFFEVHLHPGAHVSPERMASDRAINGAVQVLRRRHGLRDAAAYAMLLQASTDTGLSLDELACGLLEEAGCEGLSRSVTADDLPRLGASDVLAR